MGLGFSNATYSLVQAGLGLGSGLSSIIDFPCLGFSVYCGGIVAACPAARRYLTHCWGKCQN